MLHTIQKKPVNSDYTLTKCKKKKSWFYSAKKLKWKYNCRHCVSAAGTSSLRKVSMHQLRSWKFVSHPKLAWLAWLISLAWEPLVPTPQPWTGANCCWTTELRSCLLCWNPVSFSGNLHPPSFKGELGPQSSAPLPSPAPPPPPGAIRNGALMHSEDDLKTKLAWPLVVYRLIYGSWSPLRANNR